MGKKHDPLKIESRLFTLQLEFEGWIEWRLTAPLRTQERVILLWFDIPSMGNKTIGNSTEFVAQTK